ncbi:MAG: hypothetical protein E3J90_07175 [Promethearchaeota archaeon]|nr:MAG: hypothetical protein E3J90_07175 [Candidatus Lokiarchaeota archaeon]
MGEKAQATKKSFFSHNDFTEDLDLLSDIKIPKKYQHTLEKIKTGIFTKTVTNAEKKLMGQSFKLQLDVFNAPANDSYQKELNKTMKRIAKISGINEIEKRLRVLKMMLLISFDNFESSVKQLNDDRKEIGLKIRKLKQTTPEKPIIEEIKRLEEDKNKIVELIKNAPKRDIHLKRKQLLEERIEKYHKEIYRFCLDFIDMVNEDLTPIKKQQGFCELYLNYDLTLTIQKKEKHIIVIDGKDHTANLKVYKFEQLDKVTKLEILTTIKRNFKKEFYENK